MNDQSFKKLKHYNTPGHAHELTFSCYRRKDYQKDPVACEIFLFELEKVVPDRFNMPVIMLNPQKQRIGIF